MLPVLEAYCRNTFRARSIAAEINKLGKSPEPTDAYFKLLDAENQMMRSLVTQAMKLRLTPQAAYDKRVKRAPAVLHKPWEG
jgi:hypothetical protein